MKKKIILSVVILVLVSFCLSEAKDRHRKYHKHHKDSVICMSWEDKTSDVYWDDGYGEGTWNVTQWESADYGTGHWITMFAKPVGSSWTYGYFPTAMRVTFTGATTLFMDIGIESGPEFAQVEELSSGQIVALNYTGYSDQYGFDLIRLIAANTETQFQVTKIEFLAPLLNGVYKFDTESYCGVLMSDISKIDGVDK